MVGSNPLRTDEYTASLTTPTMRNAETFGPSSPVLISCPTALVYPKKRRANDSLTTNTFGACAVSCSSRSRPETTRMPNVLNHPGDTMLTHGCRCLSGIDAVAGGGSTLVFQRIEPMGTSTDVAAFDTPGTDAAASRSRSYNCSLASRDSSFFLASTSMEMMPSGSKPRLVPDSAVSVRTKSTPPTTSASESATCTATRMLRTPKRRSPVTVRDCCLIASLAEMPVTPIAGAMPKNRAVSAVTATVKSMTRQSSDKSSVTPVEPVASCL